MKSQYQQKRMEMNAVSLILETKQISLIYLQSLVWEDLVQQWIYAYKRKISKHLS